MNDFVLIDTGINEMTTSELVHKVQTREDFAEFVKQLYIEFPTGWENIEMETYLIAISSVAESIDGLYQNFGLPFPEQPTWQLFAQILHCATVYE
jgi:hypothetical protein